MLDVHLRPARPEDHAPLAEFYCRVWHETHALYAPAAVAAYRSLDFFRQRIDANRPAPLIAERRGLIVGFAAWQGDTLGQLFVGDGERGRGLGAVLLREAEQAMARAGVAAARLTCAPANEGAIRFYLRHGWTLGERVTHPTQIEGGTVETAAQILTKPLGTATGS